MGLENPSSLDTDDLHSRYQNHETNTPFIVQNACTIRLNSIGDENGLPTSPHEKPTLDLKPGDVIKLCVDDYSTTGAKMKINDKTTVWVTPFELSRIITIEN